MLPKFISKEIIRSYLSSTELNKHLSIDGILPSSYIARCEREGRAIPHKIWKGQKRWRLLDVIARANAEAVRIEPPYPKKIANDIDALEAKKANLVNQVSALEEEIKHTIEFMDMSRALTGATLLSESQIVKNSAELPIYSGVYFLIKNNKIIYVGQSVNIFRRIMDHLPTKRFDKFSYIRCKKENLDIIESLYIHHIKPPQNADKPGEHGKYSPLRIDQIIKGLEREKVES